MLLHEMEIYFSLSIVTNQTSKRRQTQNIQCDANWIAVQSWLIRTATDVRDRAMKSLSSTNVEGNNINNHSSKDNATRWRFGNHSFQLSWKALQFSYFLCPSSSVPRGVITRSTRSWQLTHCIYYYMNIDWILIFTKWIPWGVSYWMMHAHH